MIETYKNQFLKANTQIIVTNYSGEVLASDNIIFNINEKDSIIEFHPFFSNLDYFINSDKKQYSFSCVNLDINNTTFICDITTNRIDDKKELVIIIQNLSEHYKSYQALTQKKNESLINEELLTLKNLRLLEKEVIRNEFIANFNHELRNPLNSIITFSELLNKTALSNEQKDYNKYIGFLSEHLNKLVEDIFNLNKIDLKSFEINYAFFNLYDLIEVLKQTYIHKLQNTNVEFVVEFDEKIPEIVKSDKLRITQVLSNLLENALRYTSSGVITLEVTLNQKRANNVSVQFSVSDTGIGIEKDNIDFIFGEFNRINPNNYEGFGLGLSITQKILSLMGSKIKVESELGKGSRFSFDLSMKFPVSSKEKFEVKTAKKQKTPNKLFDFKHHILLVEDDPILQMLIFKILIETKDFYVDLVSTGEDAIDKVLNKSYDLIIMDIKLPGMDGIEATKFIKDIPSNKIKRIPVLAFTGVGFDEKLSKPKKIGFKDVIRKPVNETEFLKTVYKYVK